MSDTQKLRGSEFLRKLKSVADQRGINLTFVPQRGKGSHGTLYFGDKFTVLRNPKDELKKGTMRGMLRQLGIEPRDFEQGN